MRDVPVALSGDGGGKADDALRHEHAPGNDAGRAVRDARETRGHAPFGVRRRDGRHLDAHRRRRPPPARLRGRRADTPRDAVLEIKRADDAKGAAPAGK